MVPMRIYTTCNYKYKTEVRPMNSLNIGILAHVDAGKTSLTERLLFTVGVIDEIGSVDDGNTQTDSLALERQRGITIRSAVASFVIHHETDVTVNLIDTPGHPDFIAEVERVLSVLERALLLSSACEGLAAPPYSKLRAALADQTKQVNVHPVFCGSAITGAGVEALMAGIAELLPAGEGDSDAAVSATVFKVERGPAGEKVAYIRVFSGSIR